MKQIMHLAAGVALAVAIQGWTHSAHVQDRAAVVATYADIAQAMYGDALTEAQELQAAIAALVASPGAETLEAAREAWLAARVPYRRRSIASATRSSTTGRAGSTPGRSTRA